MRKFTKEFNHYLPLIGIILAGTLGVILFSYDQVFQAILAIVVAACYVLWGLVHHHLHHDLEFNVFVEYLAIASIGVMIVLTLIYY
ncbi:hypothetical protein ACFL2C_00605 [Patescibacteria group bacterium]